MVESFCLAITIRSSVWWIAVDDAVARNLYIREVHASDGQAILLLVRERGREAVETVNRVKMSNFYYYTIFWLICISVNTLDGVIRGRGRDF